MEAILKAKERLEKQISQEGEQGDMFGFEDV
jgi:hypothetical protein